MPEPLGPSSATSWPRSTVREASRDRRGAAERLVDADGVDRGRGRHGDGPYRITLGGLLRRCEDHLTPKYTAARPPQKVVMLSRLIRMRWPIPVAVLVLLVAVVAVAVLANRDDGPTLVVYNGRSHYGDEEVFEDFEEATGIEVELRGRHRPGAVRAAPAGGRRTPRPTCSSPPTWPTCGGPRTPGCSPPSTRRPSRPTCPRRSTIPTGPGGRSAPGCGSRSSRPSASTPPRSRPTSPSAIPQFQGRTCLRTSSNEYNQSLVADMIAKRGYDETRALLESWMANDPDIINSDGELLGVIAAGDCDLGLTNHYYLGRALLEDPDFPVAPAWPDQDGAGAHTNVSGVGVVDLHRPARGRHRADRVPHDREGRGPDHGGQRVRGQPGGAAARPHRRLGRGEDGPDRRRPRRARCSTTRSS